MQGRRLGETQLRSSPLREETGNKSKRAREDWQKEKVMSEPFATVEDIATLWRPLTQAEENRANALLPIISDTLRQYGISVGVDLDEKAEEEDSFASVLKMTTVDIVSRVLRQSTEGDLMTQESQSGLGYSWQGTYAIPGGGIGNAIMYSDLKRLGLLVQTAGVVELWDGLKAQQ